MVLAPLSSESGALSSVPDTGYIGCATRWFDKTILSDGTINTATHLRFNVPDVDSWSFGFVYHTGDGGASFNATFLHSPPSTSNVHAIHWTAAPDTPIDVLNESVEPRLMRSEGNVLVFRTSEHGAFLRLNNATVFRVPASDLARQTGYAEVCVGFYNYESEPYSVAYSDLRRDFARKDDAGTLLHDGGTDGYVSCNQLVLSTRTTSAWGLFDFVAPATGRWSLALRYHENARRGAVTRTAIGMDGAGAFYSHNHWLRGELDPVEVTGEFSRWLIRRGRDALNTVEFELRPEGFWLRLNGEQIIGLPADALRPYPGRLEVCAGQFQEETERYQIRYSDLWAWVP